MRRSVFLPRKWRASLPIVFLVLSSISQLTVGRKCVCTSKACKEAGVDVCRTRFSCYTENNSTRGCTERATPLLCEANAWTRSSGRGTTLRNVGLGSTNVLSVEVDENIVARQEILWPRLKCCDSHDYCNSIVIDNANRDVDRTIENTRIGSTTSHVDDEISSGNHRNGTILKPEMTLNSSIGDREKNYIRTRIDREESYDPVKSRVGSLHVAVVVLAIAALTSVLGACYVVTRFLRSPFEIGSP